MKNPLKIRLLRGICLRARGNVAYKAGITLTVDSATKDPNELELLRLAQPGATHMGRKVAEFVLDGPGFEFTAAHLEMIRMAGKDALPKVAENLAMKLDCSFDHAAALLAQALNIDVRAFDGEPVWMQELDEPAQPDLEVEPVVESEPEPQAPAGPAYTFSKDEIEQLRQMPVENRAQVVPDLAEMANVSIEDAQALLVAQVGGDWPLPAPAEPDSKPSKRGNSNK